MHQICRNSFLPDVAYAVPTDRDSIGLSSMNADGGRIADLQSAGNQLSALADRTRSIEHNEIIAAHHVVPENLELPF